MYQKTKIVFKKYGKKILGILLILTGIIGFFLPFLPGLLLIIAGMILLGNKLLAIKMRQFWQYLKR